MGFLIKIHSTWCFLPTYDHIRGFSVLKAHFTGVREKLDIWAKSSLFTSTPKELSLPKPLPQTALIHWPHPRKALAQSPNLLFKFLATFEFQSSKYTRKSSVLSPHLPRKPWSPFSQSLRLLVFLSSEFIEITQALSHEWVCVCLNGRQKIKKCCSLRSFSVLHPWTPRPLSLHCCWYTAQRGTIACRKRNTALLAVFIIHYLCPIIPNAEFWHSVVSTRKKAPLCSPLKYAKYTSHILGVGGNSDRTEPRQSVLATWSNDKGDFWSSLFPRSQNFNATSFSL